uniref:Dynein assembly factor 1, axonemal homolog n=1 Tax=Chromera velia CCMP2878 TaxID=1169474 RepID=A0A0G4G2C9_9ALVE|eukprot:Cvel_19937.t1-p1 / transcript=Cvel_19937.t1 / gene=Cvel_19937 / organism=Chromera_velia_CCMP2878 / gene_product=Dynein assembly factor 1, axonemal, putative / transcript_product=Dynein assembly factor 1, axonemal, putative / location=Cvel_scaffold1754:20056-24334(+) / protein_length=486 / sequence_SO=supercontig / SO=protein_coding / is_pseudo=false
MLRSDRRTYYSTPELNDKLYIHFKGFRKIENLEEFTGIKVLYGEGNGFAKIEGLDTMTKLRSLYLQENCIREIENLENVEALHTLNLSNNFITHIKNLKNHKDLHTLYIASNNVGQDGLGDLEELKDCDNLAVLDIQHNRISDEAVLPDVLCKMKNLAVLYLKGNPVVKKIANYRKRVIASIPGLKYLDDRPVFEDDRRCAEAFMRGGFPEERAERRRMQEEKQQEHRRNHDAFMAMVRDARREHDEREAMLQEDHATTGCPSSDRPTDSVQASLTVGGHGQAPTEEQRSSVAAAGGAEGDEDGGGSRAATSEAGTECALMVDVQHQEGDIEGEECPTPNSLQSLSRGLTVEEVGGVAEDVQKKEEREKERNSMATRETAPEGDQLTVTRTDASLSPSPTTTSEGIPKPPVRDFEDETVGDISEEKGVVGVSGDGLDFDHTIEARIDEALAGVAMAAEEKKAKGGETINNAEVQNEDAAYDFEALD